MLTKQEITDIIKNNISRIQKNYNVKRLGLFGSFIREWKEMDGSWPVI